MTEQTALSFFMRWYMRLSNLMNGIIPKSEIFFMNESIKKIETDSRMCDKDSIFFAMKGKKDNGMNYIDDAVKRGVKVIVSEEAIDRKDIKNVVVDDARKAYSIMAANLFECPAKSMKIIAVVGTNGKSTTAHFIYEILKNCGLGVGIIGTHTVKYNDVKISHSMTTPDPVDLNRYLKDMEESGIEYVVMEVSAHAIYLEKLYGIKFDMAVFTNFSQDHLDYFKDMEEYGRIKAGFFKSSNVRLAIVNIDDILGRKIIKGADIPIFTYGLENPSDVFAIDIESGSRTKFIVNILDEVATFDTALLGRFNVYNILGASLVARLIGISLDEIRESVKDIAPCEGRFNVIIAKDVKFVIDYAHTPDGLCNILKELRNMTENENKLRVVFGCGGDRDKSKRAVMGKIAGEYADEVILTSDNPRSEGRLSIIDDIRVGVGRTATVILPDREDAIRYAYNMSDCGDIVLIAGKGAENYIEENGTKKYFSDKETLLRIKEEENGI